MQAVLSVVRKGKFQLVGGGAGSCFPANGRGYQLALEAAKALTAPKAVATARPAPHFMRIQS